MSINDWIAIYPGIAALMMAVIGGAATLWPPRQEQKWLKTGYLVSLLLFTATAGLAVFLNQKTIADQATHNERVQGQLTQTINYMKGELFVLVRHSSHKEEARRLWTAYRRLDRTAKSSDPAEIASLRVELQEAKDTLKKATAFRGLDHLQQVQVAEVLRAAGPGKVGLHTNVNSELERIARSIRVGFEAGGWTHHGTTDMSNPFNPGIWIIVREGSDRGMTAAKALISAGLDAKIIAAPEPKDVHAFLGEGDDLVVCIGDRVL